MSARRLHLSLHAYIGTHGGIIKYGFMSFTPSICDIIHILKYLLGPRAHSVTSTTTLASGTTRQTSACTRIAGPRTDRVAAHRRRAQPGRSFMRILEARDSTRAPHNAVFSRERTVLEQPFTSVAAPATLGPPSDTSARAPRRRTRASCPEWERVVCVRHSPRTRATHSTICGLTARETRDAGVARAQAPAPSHSAARCFRASRTRRPSDDQRNR
jgi:hypothetical protein